MSIILFVILIVPDPAASVKSLVESKLCGKPHIMRLFTIVGGQAPKHHYRLFI